MSFTVQPQEKDLWCWAAVAATVSDYFSPGGRTTQCRVAGRTLRLSNCCNPGNDCDRTAFLQRALAEVGPAPDGHLRATAEGPIGFDLIEDEINAKRPVGVRIGWFNGGGHFVLICGYSVSPLGTPYVVVEDPWYAPMNPIPFVDFRDNYLGAGRWTGSFLLRA